MRLVGEPFLARVPPCMGMPPHNWLLRRRIEVAKGKLRDSRMPLSDVAFACGFADQSHLTESSPAWSA